MAIRTTSTATTTTRSVDGDMTVEEFKEWLMKFDTDRDGRISREELKRAIRSIRGRFSGWKSHRGIRFADSDGSGFIDEAEMGNLVEFARKSLGLKIAWETAVPSCVLYSLCRQNFDQFKDRAGLAEEGRGNETIARLGGGRARMISKQEEGDEEFGSSFDSDQGYDEEADYEGREKEEEDEEIGREEACPADQDRKSHNVAALVRYAGFSAIFDCSLVQMILQIAESRVSFDTKIDRFGVRTRSLFP
ncbi:hypothetical protein GW17_00001490 [Ensete ventricosum]|nr:hypothetical protein GW17_00001490 [Ensete ventricosum]